MAQDEICLIHSQLRTAQDKYTYFLLAIAASAIAFSVQITKTESFSTSLVPLGLAVLSWGGSFFLGCRHIEYVNSTLYANAEYLKMLSGVHPPEVGGYIQAVSEGIVDAMESDSNKASALGKLQFRLLILGGVLFIIWHLVEMTMRTVGGN